MISNLKRRLVDRINELIDRKLKPLESNNAALATNIAALEANIAALEAKPDPFVELRNLSARLDQCEALISRINVKPLEGKIEFLESCLGFRGNGDTKSAAMTENTGENQIATMIDIRLQNLEARIAAILLSLGTEEDSEDFRSKAVQALSLFDANRTDDVNVDESGSDSHA